MKLKLYILILLPFIIHCSSDKKEEAPSTSKEFEVVEEFRIDNPEDLDEFYFSSVSHIAIGNNGNIFVGDSQLPTVSMFDEEGSFVKTIGQEGRGPGEYLVIGGLETLPDGKIVLWDQRNSRVNYYSTNGDYISSQTYAVGYYSEKVFEIGYNDNFFFKKGVFDPDKREIKEMVWIEYSQTGEVLDTLFIPKQTWADYVIWTSSGNTYPFTETNITAIHPSGFLVTGHNSEYSIKRLYSDSMEIEYERTISKVNLSTDEISNWEEINRRRRVQSNLPDLKPYFKSIKIGLDGRIWVWRYIEARNNTPLSWNNYDVENGWWEQPTFDVFLESGEFFGTVKLPFNAKFMEAKGENVWAIHTDENGEETVVQYKLSAI